MIRKTIRGHEIVEGTYNGQPMLTLCNEISFNKAKHTMGVNKCKEVLDTLPAIIEFVLTHDPNYKLLDSIELVDNNGTRTIRVVKAS